MPVLTENKIIDTRPFMYTFTEDIDPTTKRRTMKVSGIFQKTDEKNENNRMYPDALWERICHDQKIKQRIEERAMIGELEHPDDLQTKLPRVSHVITKLEKRGCEIWGEAEILPTPAGLILQELFRAKVKVGISSRGRGTSTWHNNVEVVNDDYILDTFDFVANPATSGAYPKVVNESLRKNSYEENENMKGLEDIQSRLDDIKLIISEGLTESKKDKYQKDLINLQKDLTKLLENNDTKLFAEELLEEIKELKKKLKEEYSSKSPAKKEEPEDSEEAKYKTKSPDEDKDLEECTKCRTKLLIEVNTKVLYCGNCQFDIPISNALSKKTLAEKLVHQIKINKVFVQQAQSLKESNKVLSHRLDNAVKTVAALVNENKKLIVENYILKLIEKYPILSKYKAQLAQCNSVQCVDKQIELLQPQLVNEVRQPVKKTEAKTINTAKPQDTITSGPNKNMVVVDKKQVNVKNNNGIGTTTKSSSLAEQLYAKMKLY